MTNQISDEALEYVKRHHKKIVAEVIADRVPSPGAAISIFMAGSPGAGKTEFSKRFLQEIMGIEKYVVRIDPDEIRQKLPQYIPGQAEVLNPAVAKAVEKVLDYVFHKDFSFLLDGTLSKIDIARKNIDRALSKNRVVLIQYLYQDPFVAWRFTQAREKEEGRNIPKDAFITQFFAARKNINILKKEYGPKIQVDLIVRNIEARKYDFTYNVDNIDRYLEQKYSEETLRRDL